MTASLIRFARRNREAGKKKSPAIAREAFFVRHAD
jgi:hypothetical protein